MIRHSNLFLALVISLMSAYPAVADDPLVDNDFERKTCKELLCGEFVGYVRGIIAEVADEAKTSKLQGERRTHALIRAGAEYAAGVPEEHRARALILALAVAMDSGDEMRKSALTERFWKAYETDEERSVRLANLGAPTMHGRQDLVRHFFIAAGLTVLLNPNRAEALSILKEVSDANGGSGFSWVDLGADLAGIIYARRLIAERVVPDPFGRSFETSSFVPSTILELPEGIMIEELRSQFSLDSRSRFQAEVRRIQSLVLALPIHKNRAPGDSQSAAR